MGVIEGKFEDNVFITSLDWVFNWARSSSPWPLSFGLLEVTPKLKLPIHGAVKPELDQARERGLEVVDGTCPYVKYPQAMAQRLSH